MKKYLHLEISTLEVLLFVGLIGWIIAGFFVPLPEVNSLGA